MLLKSKDKDNVDVYKELLSCSKRDFLFLNLKSRFRMRLGSEKSATLFYSL